MILKVLPFTSRGCNILRWLLNLHNWLRLRLWRCLLDVLLLFLLWGRRLILWLFSVAIVIVTFVLKDWITFLILVIDGDDPKLGTVERASTIIVCNDLSLFLVVKQLLLFLVRVRRDQTPDLFLLVQNVTERVLFLRGDSIGTPTFLVICRILRVAQLLKHIRHTSLTILTWFLIFVAHNC